MKRYTSDNILIIKQFCQLKKGSKTVIFPIDMIFSFAQQIILANFLQHSQCIYYDKTTLYRLAALYQLHFTNLRNII